MLKKIKESLRYKIRRVYYKYIKSLSKKELSERFSKLDFNKKYLVLHNPNWLGITSATKSTFSNTLAVEELYSKKQIYYIAEYIIANKYSTVIFSGMVDGWPSLIKELKKQNKNIKIKIVWHGSNALISEKEDYLIFKKVLELYKEKLVDQLVFVKKSMYEFYKAKGYNTYFLMNNVSLDKNKEHKGKKNNSNVKVGLYSSGNRWVKNTYVQICAISLIKNVDLDCVAYDNKIYEFSKLHGLKLKGSSHHIPREELFKRMSVNDVNVYATFTECAPMLPLESFELGVPCVTSNNHHYFKGTELEKLTVVSEIDNIMAIKEKIDNCLKNKEKIMKLYKEWKIEYDIEVKNNIEEFLKQV
ncbi:MAG: hypothetical protein RRY16_01805 [Bacilli bacterium]